MSSPNFSLSLDEFPGLLDSPVTHEAHLGETVVNALREALASCPSLDYPQLELTFNQLRQEFEVQGDEHRSMIFADLMLAIAPQYSYVLNILGEWNPETEPEKFVRSLLDKATRFRDMPALYANCLWRASKLCQKAELKEVARKLFLQWQGLPTPNYPELDWLKLPFKRTNSTLQPFVTSQHHSLISPPEVVEDARNGWRDGRWNPISPLQEELLRPLLEKHDLQNWADNIVAMSQNCIRFEKGGHQTKQIGTSRLGGLPDVPEGWTWPENLEFLAQFNLEEIAPFDVNHALRSRGLLRIFAVNDTLDQCHVELDESDVKQLHRASCPPGYTVYELDGYGDLNVYSAIAVTPCRVISLPLALSEDCEEDEFEPDLEEIHAIHEQLMPSHTYQWNHQLLGIDNQGFFVTRNEQDPVLLFMMDSNQDLGTNFNDRALLFSTSCQDLARSSFNNVDVGII